MNAFKINLLQLNTKARSMRYGDQRSVLVSLSFTLANYFSLIEVSDYYRCRIQAMDLELCRQLEQLDPRMIADSLSTTCYSASLVQDHADTFRSQLTFVWSDVEPNKLLPLRQRAPQSTM